MNRNRIIAILLAAVLMLTFAPDFGNNASAAGSTTLSVFIGDPGSQPAANNKIYRLIEQKFGMKFEFEFFSGNLEKKISSMISSKKLPDLIDGSYASDTLISKGALVNLLDYISPEKTPRLWSHISPYRSRLITKDKKGRDALYIIPNYGIVDGTQTVNEINGPAFFIQKKVLADAGYPDVKDLTIDDYFSLIDRYLENHPTNEDGVPYVGFAIMCEDWRNFCLINPVQHLMGRPNDGDVLVDISDEALHTEFFINKEYAKAYYKKLNEEYQKNTIISDTFNVDYDSYIQWIEAGLVLGMFDQTWDFSRATENLLLNGMFDSTYVALGPVYSQDTPGIPEGWQIEEHYVNGSGPNINRGFGISVNCKNPEKIVSMWETMLSNEWQLIFNWGIENEDYYIENGRLRMTDEQYRNTNDWQWRLANKADAFFNASPKKQGTILSGPLAGNSWMPANQDEVVYSQLNDYDKEFLEHYGYSKWSDFMNPPVELAPYGEAWAIDTSPISEEYFRYRCVLEEWLPVLIQCEPERFDTLWAQFIELISPYIAAMEPYMQDQIRDAADDDTLDILDKGTFGGGLSWTLEKNGILTISGTGDMPDFESEDPAPWKDYMDRIIKVVINYGVTGIGDRAFYECDSLYILLMADSVTRIGNDVCMRCPALKYVILSGNLAEIGSGAFSECPRLSSITLPGSLETLGTGSFAGSNLSTITLPDGAAGKEWDFFYPAPDENLYLYHLTLPAGITDAGYGAFSRNPLPHDTPNFILPSEVETIEPETFRETNPRFVWLSDNMTSIGTDAFAGCSALEYIYIPSGCVSIAPNAFPEGTAILGISGYDSPCYAENYANTYGYTFINLEDPLGGNG